VPFANEMGLSALCSELKTDKTRNCKRRQAAAKPAACSKPLMLSTLGRKGKREGEVGKEV